MDEWTNLTVRAMRTTLPKQKPHQTHSLEMNTKISWAFRIGGAKTFG